MSKLDKSTKPKLTKEERKAKYPPKKSDQPTTDESTSKTTMTKKNMAKLGEDNYTVDEVDNRPRDQANPIVTHKKSTIIVDGKEIDPWAIDPVTPDNPLKAPLEESSFATLFPKYRERYLREVWPIVSSTLTSFGIQSELNLVEGSMTVKTTRKMIDPYMIIKARDVIKLLARSFPVQQALKVLQDGVYCDVIKIKGMVQNKETFIKRRGRLIGPNGATLKAIELLTGCYILVQGTTVAVMGPYKQLDIVKQIVEDTMHNIHPVYRIKQMMIERELAKNEALQGEDWNRFIPKITKKNVQRQKTVIKQKKEYTPFPTDQLPRKVDLEMASGAYWLKKSGNDDKKQNKNDIFTSQPQKRKGAPQSDEPAPRSSYKKQKFSK